ncbi:MAG: intermembrane transport protein PqiB [Myxococcota bacterium]
MMAELIPEARRIKRRLPGVVWAVPAAALIVVGYLAINAVLERGVEVVVTFDDAAGAKVRDTEVNYKGLTVGRVTKIELADDHEHVEMTLLMSRSVSPLLTTGTQFWLVGANPSLSDLSSLTAAVTGLSIEMAPGPGERATRFSGLDRAPVIYPGTPGKRIVLRTEQRGSLKPGARVAYHGDDAGNVTEVRFVAPNGFEIDAFVIEPFAQALREESYFWISGGVQLSLSAEGVTTNLPAASDLLAGGIAFDTPPRAFELPPAPDGAGFRLFADESSARDGNDGPDVLYEATFDSGSGAVAGAPVTLLGFRIGRVRSSTLHADAETGAVSTPMTVALHPRRLGFDEKDRVAMDAFMRKLLERGYRLRVTQSPPLVGASSLELVRTDSRASLVQGALHPKLPVTTTGDLATLTSTAASILAKIDSVPIKDIGDELKGTAARLNRALATIEPQLEPTLRELRASATAVQGTAVEARAVMTGEGAAQGTSFPEAMRQLTKAARSLRALADSIERNPESLLFGKSEDKQ